MEKETLKYCDDESGKEYLINIEVGDFSLENDVYDYATGNVYQKKCGYETWCYAEFPPTNDKFIMKAMKDYVRQIYDYCDEFNF